MFCQLLISFNFVLDDFVLDDCRGAAFELFFLSAL